MSILSFDIFKLVFITFCTNNIMPISTFWFSFAIIQWNSNWWIIKISWCYSFKLHISWVSHIHVSKSFLQGFWELLRGEAESTTIDNIITFCSVPSTTLYKSYCILKFTLKRRTNYELLFNCFDISGCKTESAHQFADILIYKTKFGFNIFQICHTKMINDKWLGLVQASATERWP